MTKKTPKSPQLFVSLQPALMTKVVDTVHQVWPQLEGINNASSVKLLLLYAIDELGNTHEVHNTPLPKGIRVKIEPNIQ